MENLLMVVILAAMGGLLVCTFLNVMLAARVLKEDPKLRGLDTRQKALELEWENTFEKLRKVAGRADREKRTAQEAISDQNSGGAATVPLPGPLSRQQLLARIRRGQM